MEKLNSPQMQYKVVDSFNGATISHHETEGAAHHEMNRQIMNHPKTEAYPSLTVVPELAQWYHDGRKFAWFLPNGEVA